MAEVEAGGRPLGVDSSYIRSNRGVLRICQIVTGLCGIISMEATGGYCWSNYSGRFWYFEFVATSTFLMAVFILVIFLIRLYERLSQHINFPLTLLASDAVAALLYLVASVLVLTTFCVQSSYNAAAKVAGVFGLLGTVFFLAHTYLDYRLVSEVKAVTSGMTVVEVGQQSAVPQQQ